MNKIFNNNKIMIVCCIVLILVIILIVFLVFRENIKETHITKDREIYIDVLAEVKVEYEESYIECSSSDEVKICSEVDTVISDVFLLNDEAVSLYENFEFKNMSLDDAIVKINDLAKSKDYEYEYIKIVTDSEFYTKDKFIELLSTNSEYKIDYKFSFKAIGSLSEDEIMDYLDSDIILYTVTFYSDKGSDIESQNVIDGEFATKPKNPSRNNYDFVEWQLDGKKYNFDEIVTDDIVLKAVWKAEIKEDSKNNNDSNVNDNIVEPEKEPVPEVPEDSDVVIPQEEHDEYPEFTYTVEGIDKDLEVYNGDLCRVSNLVVEYRDYEYIFDILDFSFTSTIVKNNYKSIDPETSCWYDFEVYDVNGKLLGSDWSYIHYGNEGESKNNVGARIQEYLNVTEFVIKINVTSPKQ